MLIMETGSSKFWLGLGLGSVLGIVLYRFSCSSKGKQLKEKACQTFHKVSEQAGDMFDSAKEKMMNTGAKVADKVADQTLYMAEKADNLKNKVHDFVDEAKK